MNTNVQQYRNDTLPKSIFIFFQNLEMNYRDDKLELEFFSLLQSVYLNLQIKSIYQPSYYGYFLFLFKMTAFVRDFEYGIGNLNYYVVFIWVWYNICPSLALHLIECAFKDTKHLSYGSWKDLKYICQFVLDKTGSKSHPIILHCVKTYVNQLKKDKQALYQNNNVSLVGKWIPREKSSFGWIFNLVSSNYYSYYMKKVTTKQKEDSANNKANMKMRKLISSLNKKIGTLEVKQCNNWNEIFSLNELTSKNLTLQSSWLLNHANNNSVHRNDLKSKLITNEINIKINYIDVIKRAWKYCETENKNDIEAVYLNRLWKKCLSSIDELIYIIPLLDCSFEIEEKDFIEGLAISLLLASKSKYKNRLVLCSNQYKWLVIEDDWTIVETIDFVRKKMNRVNSDLNFCFTSFCQELYGSKEGSSLFKYINLIIITNGNNINFLKNSNNYNLKITFWLINGMPKEYYNAKLTNYSIVSGKNIHSINFFWSKKDGSTSITLLEDMFYIKYNSKYLTKSKFSQLDFIVANWFTSSLNHF